MSGTAGRMPYTAMPTGTPQETLDVPLVRRAVTLCARLSDYHWKVSTGPLVWNRARDRISDRHRDGSVKILWAADLENPGFGAPETGSSTGGLRCVRARSAPSSPTALRCSSSGRPLPSSHGG